MKKLLLFTFTLLCSNYLFADTATIAHSEGVSCYDQDQVYKRCVDQNELFKIAKSEAKESGKDVLVIYGYDTCSWCRSIHNIMFFSDQSQFIQSQFVIRTIAKSSGNVTGSELINSLRASKNIKDEMGLPYLIIVDGQTGQPKKFINTESLEQNFESWGWSGHNLVKVIESLSVQ